ncbi:MAG: phosphodiester glycosidase family protein [Staphylococcus equorum]|nr:phosphodiester glycosidase family protein [Staphylococcus equorum]
MALQENLPYKLNTEFRGYLVQNFKTINQDRQYLLDKVKEYESKKQLTKDIEHNNQKLNNVLDVLTKRIDNQIYGASGNSTAELKDLRVDMEGGNHDLAQDRLNHDLNKINSTATQADETAQKHEDQISESAYYQEITYVSGRKYDTTYKIVHIPHEDSNGDIIKLKKGLAGRSGQLSAKTARTFAQETGATFVSNASTGSMSKNKLHGQQIYEGQILDTVKGDEYDQIKDRWTLAVANDNTMEAFPQEVTAQELKDKGYHTTFSGFGPLIMGGKVVYKDKDYGDSGEPNPRTIIAQLPNKDILIFTCDGRLNTSHMNQRGLKLEEATEVLFDHYGEIDFAYNLDGGGSSSAILRSKMLNKPSDNNNRDERKVLDFIYFGKEARQPRDIDIQNAYKDIGEVRGYAQFLYGMFQLWNSFEATELKLKNYNDYTGLVAQDGDTPKKKFYLNDTGFRFWDYKTERTWFKVDELGALLHNHRLAQNYSAPEQVENINNISLGGTYLISKKGTGTPFKDQSSAIVTQYNVTYADLNDGSTAFQTALPFARTSGLSMKRRSYSNGKWSQWFDV